MILLMNLVLRPLADYNDVTWSIVISLIILLIGVAYYIYTIMTLAFQELEDAESNSTERRGTVDQEIALLKHRVEELEEGGVDELSESS